MGSPPSVVARVFARVTWAGVSKTNRLAKWLFGRRAARFTEGIAGRASLFADRWCIPTTTAVSRAVVRTPIKVIFNFALARTMMRLVSKDGAAANFAAATAAV